MTTASFHCPKCGAPLDAHDVETPTIRCPYCATSVIVPDELRAKPDPAPVNSPAATVAQIFHVESTPRTLSKKATIWIALLVIGVALSILASIIIPILASASSIAVVSRALPPGPGVTLTPSATPTRTPTPTITPTPSPTPAYMVPALSFGGEGIGPGLFNNARYIDLDRQGTVYVADYQGGRVQVFDADGKYLRQWRLGDQNTIFAGLAADRQGRVFVSVGKGITGIDGQSGEIVIEIVNPAGGTFGDLLVDAQGRLAAAWYEGRWGMITSLEGHRESLVFYDPSGRLLLDVPSFISNQTGALALDNYIAVDGLGMIYALSDNIVYKFAPDGRFLDRWDIRADAGKGSALAVDGQGGACLWEAAARYSSTHPKAGLRSSFRSIGPGIWPSTMKATCGSLGKIR